MTTTTANLERHTVAIIEWIRRGEIEAARSAFNYATRDADSVEDLVKALGTDDEIRAARREFAQGMSCRSIARRMGVHSTTISRLIRGDHWRDYLVQPPGGLVKAGRGVKSAS